MIIPVLDGNGSLVYFEVNGTGTANDPYQMVPPNSHEGPVKENFTIRANLSGECDGTDFNQAVDGSITPVVFKIKPDPGVVLRVHRLILYVQDTGTFDSDKWGNGIVMANGIDFEYIRQGVPKTLCQFMVKTSGDMSGLCFDYNHVIHGAGDEYGVWRYTFDKSGNPIRLVGDDGDEIRVIINDDLTGLSKQFATYQGEYEQ